MAEIVAHFTNQGVPLVSPTDAPTIRIRRVDTGALVVTDAAMTELGDGNFRYSFTPVTTLKYSIRADGDPNVTGQVTSVERYSFGSLSGDPSDTDSEIIAHFTNNGVPLTSPANAPTLRIRRTDTGALVVTDDAMTEVGDGSFHYSFTLVSSLAYALRADGDPTAAGQVSVLERYVFGSVTQVQVGSITINVGNSVSVIPEPAVSVEVQEGVTVQVNPAGGVVI